MCVKPVLVIDFNKIVYFVIDKRTVYADSVIIRGFVSLFTIRGIEAISIRNNELYKLDSYVLSKILEGIIENEY